MGSGHLVTPKRDPWSFPKTLLADLGTLQNVLRRHVLRVHELAFLSMGALLPKLGEVHFGETPVRDDLKVPAFEERLHFHDLRGGAFRRSWT